MEDNNKQNYALSDQISGISNTEEKIFFLNCLLLFFSCRFWLILPRLYISPWSPDIVHALAKWAPVVRGLMRVFFLIGFYIISFKTTNMWVGCQTWSVLMHFHYPVYRRTLISLSLDTIFIWWKFSISRKLQRQLVPIVLPSHAFILVTHLKRQQE